MKRLRIRPNGTVSSHRSGAPRDLMGIEGGVFKNLVENSGEKDVLEKMIFA